MSVICSNDLFCRTPPPSRLYKPGGRNRQKITENSANIPFPCALFQPRSLFIDDEIQTRVLQTGRGFLSERPRVFGECDTGQGHNGGGKKLSEIWTVEVAGPRFKVTDAH